MSKAANKKLAKELQERFQKEMPGKRLLAIHLDGFSHHLIYDSGTKDSQIRSVEVSFCVSEREELYYCRDDSQKQRVSAARRFLRESGYGRHACYQNNAQEILLVDPTER